MHALFICLAIVAGLLADPDEAQQAEDLRDRIVAYRVANDNFTLEQARAFKAKLDEMPPRAIRMIAMVYNRRYSMSLPYDGESLAPADETEAMREEIVAKRVSHERLSAADAKAFLEKVDALSPREVRILAVAEQDRADRERGEARARLELASRDAKQRANFNKLSQQAAMNMARQNRQMTSQAAVRAASTPIPSGGGGGSSAAFGRRNAINNSMSTPLSPGRNRWNGYRGGWGGRIGW